MRTYWKLQLDCSNEVAAKKVVNQVIKQLGRPQFEADLESYSKGGYIASFQLSLSPYQSYSEDVLEAIHLGQKLGGGWLVTGNVHEDISAVLSSGAGSSSVVAGLTWAEWQIFNDKLGEQGGETDS